MEIMEKKSKPEKRKKKTITLEKSTFREREGEVRKGVSSGNAQDGRAFHGLIQSDCSILSAHRQSDNLRLICNRQFIGIVAWVVRGGGGGAGVGVGVGVLSLWINNYE